MLSVCHTNNSLFVKGKYKVSAKNNRNWKVIKTTNSLFVAFCVFLMNIGSYERVQIEYNHYGAFL